MLSYQQDEQRRRDRQARDESAIQAFLRYETAAKEKKAQASLLLSHAILATVASFSCPNPSVAPI